MIRFYAGSDVEAPEPVECELVGWPNYDAKGRMQFENSHFDTDEAAWDCILANARAWVSLSASSVESARESLANKEASLAQSSLHRERAEAGYKRWKQSAATVVSDA